MTIELDFWMQSQVAVTLFSYGKHNLGRVPDLLREQPLGVVNSKCYIIGHRSALKLC